MAGGHQTPHELIFSPLTFLQFGLWLQHRTPDGAQLDVVRKSEAG